MEATKQITRLIESHPGPVTVADLVRAGFLAHMTLPGVYRRVNSLPAGERPEDHGAVRAGGNIVWISSYAAAQFVERHLAYWEAKERRK